MAILLSIAFGATDSPPLAVWVGTLISVYGAAALAYVTSRHVFGLSRDVKEAREMGSYRLVEQLGCGGMGEVWRAEHRMLARPAAVKLIRREKLQPGVDTRGAQQTLREGGRGNRSAALAPYRAAIRLRRD